MSNCHKSLAAIAKLFSASLSEIDLKQFPEKVMDIISLISDMTFGHLATSSFLMEAQEKVNKTLADDGVSVAGIHYDYHELFLGYDINIGQNPAITVRDYGMKLDDDGKISRQLDIFIKETAIE